MKIVIVIPTYNEAENITQLVPMLAREFKKIDHEIVTLFVDDNSPDGTAKILKKLKSKYSFINLVVQPKKTALGTAYVVGFKKAMNEMGADVVMEMDADLQHDPKEISSLIRAIEDGADYVIGSRYVKGGSIPSEWAFYRKLISWGGSFFARVVLGMLNVKDFTTGYRATRVKGVLDKINLDTIMSQGFAYKIDLLYRFHKLGAKITEVPIKFGLRNGGDSKMERNNMIDSLRVVLTLRARESASFVKFAVVGSTGVGVDFMIFNVLRLTVLSSGYSSAVSGFIAMITTYLLNNAWSFKHHKITSFTSKFRMFVPYALSSYIPIIFRSWLIKYVTGAFSDTALVANAALFVGMGIGMVWNYTVYSKIIWRKKRT